VPEASGADPPLRSFFSGTGAVSGPSRKEFPHEVRKQTFNAAKSAKHDAKASVVISLEELRLYPRRNSLLGVFKKLGIWTKVRRRGPFGGRGLDLRKSMPAHSDEIHSRESRKASSLSRDIVGIVFA